MQDFLVNYYIVCYLPAGNKATLCWTCHAGHDLLEPITHYLGYYFVINITETDQSELGWIFGVGHLGDKGYKCIIHTPRKDSFKKKF